ncbi:hypothetical protein HYG86_12450 [Alkalicella caledoniensis]|uniref:Uncharacterized protein n=1 Tax=Alkalicella caledoniensis TaxID=2731377 RepID=A0A7G9WA09_ALKCA|nr:hypothetical protein [Alkalicella caledoniensis]QNO15521.1 hypothetical protein HYG86_12450 [Alkalicella caledoniensis]
MNNIDKIARFQLKDFRKSVMIYYTVIFTIILLMFITTRNSDNLGQSNMSGGTFIFMFILGLNCFKTAFKLMQANNITRKSFYIGNIIALLSTSLVVSFIDSVLNRVLKQIVPYAGNFEQIFGNQSFFGDFIWTFSLLFFAMTLGWMITMIYYRSNSIAKILVSISPVFLIVTFGYIDRINSGALSRWMFDSFMKTMGLYGGNSNFYVGIFSFLIATLIILIPNILLMNKAPIKD